MANAGDFAYTLKQQADIVRVVGDYVKLRKAGAQNFSGLCPFHSENTPSFSVHATRQFFHCFGCGASGDVFSFVQKIENITFPEAVRAVAQKLNIPLPKASFSSPAEAKEAKLRTVLLDVHERACAFFQECLRRPEGARAREYLAGRGLDEETIRRFRIGFAPDSGFLVRDRLKGDFDEAVLRESGLFSWKEASSQPSAVSRQVNSKSLDSPRHSANEAAELARDDNGGVEQQIPPFGRNDKGGSAEESTAINMYSKFRNRVMFPIASEAGKVIAFTGRTLSTDEKAGPKYLNSPETAIYSKSKVLFNLDTAGAHATERTLALLVEEEFQIQVLTLDPGFDPDLFIRRKGKDAYAAALKNSQRYFDYLIERARAQFPIRSAEGKVKAVNYLLPHIQRVPSRIVRDELAHEIAQKLGIDSAVLRQELKHAAANRSAATLKAPMEGQVTDAEKILIRALASGAEMQSSGEHLSSRDGADEEEFDPARQAQFALRNESLHVGLATELLIEALLNASPEMTNPTDLSLSDGDRNLMAAILMKEDEELSPERLEGAVKALRRIQLRRKLEQVQRDLQGRGLDSSRVQDLLQEKLRLKRMLMDPGLAAGDAEAQSA